MNTAHRTVLQCTFVMVALNSWVRAETFMIENGQPRAEIVIAEHPQRTVRLAAQELQDYVRKISGAHLPIVTAPSGEAVKLFVGRSSHTDKLGVTAAGLKYGAYRLVSGDDWMVFLGDDTDFVPLEPWGRNHNELVSGKVQKEWEAASGLPYGMPNRTMYKDRVSLPATIGLPDVAPPPGKNDTLHVWNYDKRGSFNAVCGYLRTLGVRWLMPGELGEFVPSMTSIPLPKIDETIRPDFEVRRFCFPFATNTFDTVKWLLRLGVNDPYGLMVAHGMATMTNHENVFAAHPDWFALYGGKRDFTPGSHKSQLCYSNEELFRETVRYCRAQFDVYGYDVVSVQPPDGYGAMCQCPLCEGKYEADLGRGSMSNYVWGFVNRVAKEVAKTHPDKLVLCCAYNSYYDPPTKIEKLEPNVQVILVGGRRPKSGVAEQAVLRDFRKAWAAKTDQPLLNFENYPMTGRGVFLPIFMARTIGQSINETKGISRGEDIWLSGSKGFEKDLAFNSFQVYFTARMYWGGKQQNIDALLNEYCRLMYGPASDGMKAFFDYCEVHWPEMETDKSKIDAALALFDAAKAKVEVSTPEAQRLAMIDGFLENLRKKETLLTQKRDAVPTLRMVGEINKNGRDEITVDGKLDESYWQHCPSCATGRLREIQTGRWPSLGTTVKAGCDRDAVYLGIRCDERLGDPLNIATTKDDDVAIWHGDTVEILLQTDAHSYYQLVVNPVGALIDYDRGAKRDSWNRWASQAEVGAHTSDDHWTIEIRIPVVEDDNDPLHQVVGRKPSESIPWYINVCRGRVRDNGAEYSALSPTGAKTFNDVKRFAYFYDGHAHKFDVDPTVTNFITAMRDASKLPQSESLAAHIALADGSQGKLTDVQQSAALKAAAAAACRLKDYGRAAALASRIPIDAEKKTVVMLNLLSQRKYQDVIDRFDGEDLTAWPFWAAGEGYYARGRAYEAANRPADAHSDYRAAMSLISDKRLQVDIVDALERTSGPINRS